MAVTIDVGKIKLTWKGAFSTTTQYEPDDLVYYTVNNDTSSYIAISTSTNQAPKSTAGVVTTTYWNSVAIGNSFAWKGTYSGVTSYVINDIVSYDDSVTTSAYINVSNSTGQVPSTAGIQNSTYWETVSKGSAASSGGTASNQVQLKSGTGFAGTSDFTFSSGIATVSNSGSSPIVLDSVNARITVNGNNILDEAAGIAIALG